MKPLLEILIGGVLALCTIVLYNWVNHPSPYLRLKATVVPPTPVNGPVNVAVEVFRLERCPYWLERTIYDSKVNKILDERLWYTTPKTKGEDKFNAPVPIRVQMEKGLGIYSVRIGSVCNPYHRLFPLWSNWIESEFVVE